MKTIYIYVNENNKDILLGYLYVDLVRGAESYSFEYDKKALENKFSDFIIDSEIFLTPGRQFKLNPREPYHFMKDASPDRWGRNLIKKNEVLKAKLEKRTPRTLGESDYLLETSDFSRMGSIRFKLKKDGEFLGINNDEIPPLVKLNQLERAAYDENMIDENIHILLCPGSSLGGSRPKATVKDTDGNLWIAKFANKTDEYDISGYEMVVNRLARKCEINVPECKILKSSTKGSTFLSKRFDRNKDERFFYSSFMTLLNADEGDSSSYSYLDIANVIKEISSSPKEDLLELFKRVAFNIIIHNHDDHLRNHAMIYKDNKWRLSPVFDINPTLDTSGLSLTIDGFSNEYNLSTLINTSIYYDLKKDEATSIILNMIEIVKRSFINYSSDYKLPNKLTKEFLDSFTLTI